MTRNNVKNSSKRDRGPSRKISSGGSDEAVVAEFALAGDSAMEWCSFSTTLTSVLSRPGRGGSRYDTYERHYPRPYKGNGAKQVLINPCESGRKAKRQNLWSRCGCGQHRSPFDDLFLANDAPTRIRWQESQARPE
jgi:hypothetical protein